MPTRSSLLTNCAIRRSRSTPRIPAGSRQRWAAKAQRWNCRTVRKQVWPSRRWPPTARPDLTLTWAKRFPGESHNSAKSHHKKLMPKSTNIPAPDLTQRPPRSPRTRLGGYALLPRMLDKGRATLVGKNGEYHFNCPLDQHFVKFTGIDPKKLLAQLKTGKGDGEILEWITANAKTPRNAWEIQQWSDYHDRRGPDSDVETMQYFTDYIARHSRTREDVRTWADVLDLDDYCSFGGKA